jgi:hypothetical protein
MADFFFVLVSISGAALICAAFALAALPSSAFVIVLGCVSLSKKGQSARINVADEQSDWAGYCDRASIVPFPKACRCAVDNASARNPTELRR